MSLHYDIVEQETSYDGYFKIVRYRIRHGLFGGGCSDILTRECFERGHSVGVLPYDPKRDAVVLVEQFRVGALDAARGPWLLEVVAGVIEPGESTEEVAHRELREEAGCEPRELLPICRYLVSPGGTSEQVALYCARLDTAGIGGVHGNPEEGEDIRVHVVPLDEALDMVATGTIHAAMPIIALQWLALNRQRLQALWLDD